MSRKLLPLSLALILLGSSESPATVFSWFFGQRGARPADSALSSNPMDDPASATSGDGLQWSESYGKAYADAKKHRRMLLINFVPGGSNTDQQQLEYKIAEQPAWQEKLQRFQLCRVPQDAQIQVKGESVRLLSHPAFAEMHNRPGVAVIDLANEDEPYYGRVVSAFPFMSAKYYRWQSDNFAAILDLPPGTITQRTMVWAVRTHPEQPASTNGEWDPALRDAAASHSQYQANIGVQGHHNWNGRFQRLRRLLGGGLPVEVVAESWPGQNMIDSCIDCVQSWRQSSGHWGAVRSAQSRYGYDIRRGPNGIWYGTGIFVR